jgi:hypothetical protein
VTTSNAFSRRRLLTGGAGALALAALGTTVARAAKPDPYSLAAWQPLLGSTFLADGGATLKLDRVTDLRKPAVKGEVASNADRFSLHFAVTNGDQLPDLVSIEHPAAGSTLLFMIRNDATALAHIDRRSAN